MSEVKNQVEAIGPRPSVMVCKGCPAYETESWSEVVEDERDNGQYAWCKAADRKSMGAYHYDHSPAPSWCPALSHPVPDVPELIERVRELEAALEPLARFSDAISADADPRCVIVGMGSAELTHGELRRARTLLKGT